MKKSIIGLLAATVLAGFTGCASGSPAPTAQEGTSGGDAPQAAFKVGATGPLTGPAALYGTAARNGAQIAVDEINALGGIQLELNYQDDEHDAEKAVNAYNTLKDWGMQVSLGSVTSTPALAVSTESYADHIFSLTPSASSTSVTDGKDNYFQMCFADPNQGSASAQYIFDQKLGTQIAVIYKNDDVYSKGIFDTFKSKATELGLSIVSETTFTEDSQQDFSVQLAAAKDAGADLVFLPIYYTPAALIFTQAKSIDYAPKFFGVDGMDGILDVENFDKSLAEGVMLLTPFNADASDAKTTAFVEKYKAAYGDTPNQFAADGYDCIYAIYQALTSGGATADMTAEQLNTILIAQFTSMTFDGLTGDAMTWGTNGQVTKQPKGMVIKDGAYVGM
ncbi:MAG: ABC transporter substrate-binding protein [Propionibacteriaceae bacterium]|jgi:branched-chain amino acid transport system substrate-binding protein|nr:ABC transporter substrate-binding protein [Propionibacteriaceae bacterium]